MGTAYVYLLTIRISELWTKPFIVYTSEKVGIGKGAKRKGASKRENEICLLFQVKSFITKKGYGSHSA
jgi:hypothetical protein